MVYKIYENFLDSPLLNHCNNLLSKPKWSYGHSSTLESKNFFWTMDLMDEKFFTQYVFNKIETATLNKYHLHRVYANGHTWGQDGDIHLDDLSDTHKTFLFYPMNWDRSFGGETEFYDDEYNLIESYIPKQNTAILFPANIFHRGTAPRTKEAKLRITVAFKLEEMS